MDRRDSGWKDQRANLIMTLRNRQGQESRRELRISTLEVDGEGDKSLTLFDSPRDVKGTAFLSFTHYAGARCTCTRRAEETGPGDRPCGDGHARDSGWKIPARQPRIMHPARSTARRQ